jgi:prephenate dehydrogenase
VAEDLAAAARELAGASGARPARGDDGPQARRAPTPRAPRPEPPETDVAGLLDRGRAGVARIPGKHGGQPRNFRLVQVVIADRPGELARLFNAAGAAGVNIEDIRLEHSPGLPVGVAELSIRPDQADTLLDAMEAGGWPVRR